MWGIIKGWLFVIYPEKQQAKKKRDLKYSLEYKVGPVNPVMLYSDRARELEIEIDWKHWTLVIKSDREVTTTERMQ